MKDIDTLISLPKDKIIREMVLETVSDERGFEKPGIKLRYDSASGMLYKETVVKPHKYTYIAKAEKGDIYKIGHTGNLEKRIRTLNSQKPYSLLGLKPIAFCEEDYEWIILCSAQRSSRILPPPFSTAKEILILSDDDLNFLIDSFGFTHINESNYPGVMTRTIRDFYDPNDGHYVKTETIIK